MNLYSIHALAAALALVWGEGGLHDVLQENAKARQFEAEMGPLGMSVTLSPIAPQDWTVWLSREADWFPSTVWVVHTDGIKTSAAVWTPRLASQQNLFALLANNTDFDDGSLIHLSQARNLFRLDLEGTQISGAGLRHLSKLQSLEVLSLARTPVTDEGLSHMPMLTSLMILDLRQTQVTRDGLRHLRKLPALASLDLNGCPRIGNADLAILKQFSAPLVSASGRHWRDRCGAKAVGALPHVKKCRSDWLQSDRAGGVGVGPVTAKTGHGDLGRRRDQAEGY